MVGIFAMLGRDVQELESVIDHFQLPESVNAASHHRQPKARRLPEL